MSTENIIITLFAKDRPGIIGKLSDTILTHEGSWLESSLSRLCGQFTGIVHISINPNAKETLLASLADLASEGIYVTVHDAELSEDSGEFTALQILVEANDRPGIVEEISAVMARLNVNVERMITECESAAMSGDSIFRADMFLALPEDLTEEALEKNLENLSNDLMVSILEDE